MDGSAGPRDGGAMKPVILRVCVAIVLSATGLILARFVSRNEDNEVTSSTSNPESSSSPSRENDEEEEAESPNQQKQEILSLKSRFEELQRKEYEMELHFERFCNLKDQEVMLIEHKSILSLEKAQLDFFRKEVLAMEEEHKRGQALVIVYLKLVGEIQELRSENGLLEGKAKKLRRKSKQLYRVVNESRKIIGVEKEFLKCVDELETKNNIVKELEGKVKDMEAYVDVLQEEKEELFMKSSNSTSEMVSVEDYRRIVEEYEELKKDYANGVKEVINLRWSNACLRHEVMRNGTNFGEIVFSPNGNLHELGLEDDQVDNALALMRVANEQHEENHHQHESSRRKRLMKKLKKWVEGNEKGKSKAEETCFGRHYLTVEPEEERTFHSRRSCSSV
ncbi:putative protein CHUP1 [Arabidopsis thaliana]|uniref:Protein CHUP1, chloroplastic n=2 Tax=Arabidopsis TaxID=3701 RepID=A0A178VVS4_ARATH|nr:hypothetical protein ISN45_At02g031370 [Arabidopsis thaliana x Arabidopsis arenosa]OAP09916.1 hypothetical protein AXX17_AT2G33350 [Arabidopsis thaliana]CAA0375070.1 unnamed protein product [Arabidopsis thaliana]